MHLNIYVYFDIYINFVFLLLYQLLFVIIVYNFVNFYIL